MDKRWANYTHPLGFDEMSRTESDGILSLPRAHEESGEVALATVVENLNPIWASRE
jgi:hypothetical protein